MTPEELKTYADIGKPFIEAVISTFVKCSHFFYLNKRYNKCWPESVTQTSIILWTEDCTKS